MGRAVLSQGTKGFAWSVILLGVAAGAWLLLGGNPATWEWTAVAALGALGFAATFVSINYQGFLPTTITYQFGSAFAYALFLLVEPGAAVLVLWFQAFFDWIGRGRRPLSGAFNVGQLALATLAATGVRALLLPGTGAVLGPRAVLVGVVSLLAFLVVNHTLTNLIISLAARRRLFGLGSIQFAGLLNEVLCVLSGVAMAILWRVSPWMILLVAVPLFLHFFLLVRLAEREQVLEAQQAELRSLQGLGLDVASELHEERLYDAVVRASVQALEASGSVLFLVDDGESEMSRVAHRGSAHEPPERIRITPFVRGRLHSARATLYDEAHDARRAARELGVSDARGLLVAPLEILGPRSGLLLLYRDTSRRAFNRKDVSSVETLVRFISMALTNARLVSDLREMQDQLIQNEKMTALGMLVSGVAHELNNPLTSVVGYTELLLDRVSDPKHRRMLESVANESHRAGKIVRNLLTFSRKHRPEKEPTDVNAIFGQILELRTYELRNRNVEVITRFGAGIPRAMIDPHQFQQVLLNLVINAEHALESVEGPRRIEIETFVRHGSLRLTVADNGPGIPKSNHGKIFLPFFTTKEVGKGTGLGLSICYGIVQEHGGRILVESPREGGARFTVEIPGAALVRAGEPPGLQERGTRRLLLVPHDEAVAATLRGGLEARGWDVENAEDGVHALEILSERDFDAILVDVAIGGMDSVSFYETVHLSRPGLARRIVFAACKDAHPARKRFVQSTGNPVVEEPFDPDVLEEVLADAARDTSSGAA